MIFDIERFLSYGQESSAVKDSAVFIKFENKEQRLEFKRQLEIYDPSIDTIVLDRPDLQDMDILFIYHIRLNSVRWGRMEQGFRFIPASDLAIADVNLSDVLSILEV